MSKLMVFSLTSLFSLSSFALTLSSSIHSIDQGKKNEATLIKLSNGQVVFVKGAKKKQLLDKALEGRAVKLEVDDGNELIDLKTLPKDAIVPEDDGEEMPLNEEEPTILSSEADAVSLFRGMNRSYYNKSECTDRAQVWAYESWKKHGLISRKVFLFFTNTYIRRYNYHWWFHVSPYTLVDSGEGAIERVLDRRYTSGPRTMKNWTDVFIRSKQNCEATTYRHYRTHKNGPEHCFVVKSAMYYRLPMHVRYLEDYGRVKTQFSLSEVNFSYRAFKRRQSAN